MRKPLIAFGLGLAVVFAVLSLPAKAGPNLIVQLSSTDAGCTQTARILPKQSYCFQAKYSETCIKFGMWDGGDGHDGVNGNLMVDGGLINCNNEFILPQEGIVSQTRTYPWMCFDSASRTAISACNLDAGASNVNVFMLEKNPGGSAYGPTTDPR